MVKGTYNILLSEPIIVPVHGYWIMTKCFAILAKCETFISSIKLLSGTLFCPLQKSGPDMLSNVENSGVCTGLEWA